MKALVILVKVVRVLIPAFNKTAAEHRGTKLAAWLGIIGIVGTAWVAVMDWVVEELPIIDPVILAPPVDAPTPAPAPDVQDSDTDATDILDVIDPPDAGGELVVLSDVQVEWDDTYTPPPIHRVRSKHGGWAQYVKDQEALRQAKR